jgi:hypothetical protein
MAAPFNKFEALGLHFGYPPCCIEQYQRRILKSHKSLYDELLPKVGIDNTGFIPCIDHLMLLVSKSITIEEVLKDRKCQHVFPKQCCLIERSTCIKK